jgi:hypothetical protein
MKTRIIFLTVLFLLPCEFWTAVISQNKPLLDPLIPAFYCICAAVISIVITFALAANLLITCCIDMFKNAVRNTSLIILLICLFFALGYVFSKIKVLNPLLNRLLPKKSVEDFFKGFKKAIGELLMITGFTVLLIRIVWMVMMQLMKANKGDNLSIVSR